MKEFKFFSQFDLDFNRYKPMWYGVEIDVPIELDGEGRGSITLNNQPFLLYRITHAIIGATYDWLTTGRYQDDQYKIEFRDENSNYQNIPMMSALLYGSAREGKYLDFAIPLAYSGTRTIHFRVINNYARVFTPEAENYTVGIGIHGVADWGQLRSNVPG